MSKQISYKQLTPQNYLMAGNYYYNERSYNRGVFKIIQIYQDRKKCLVQNTYGQSEMDFSSIFDCKPIFMTDDEYNNIEQYFNTLVVQKQDLDEQPITETSLVKMDKEYYLSILEQRTLIASKLSAVYTEMQERLENKLRQFNKIREGVLMQVRKIESLIYKIELYLGIEEEITVLKQGNTTEAPITVRQHLRFMDELVGNPEDDGLDFKNLEDFDVWLLQYNSYYNCYNYEHVVPDLKSVVIIKVRRHDKHYSNDWLVNFRLNVDNKKVYFLIRNGENLYRIWTDKNPSAFFPSKKEYAELIEHSTQNGYRQTDTLAKLDSYKTNFLILQGLIDRTTLLQPTKNRINLFTNEELNSNDINLVYEDPEFMLYNSRPNFRQWLKTVNSKVTEGARIYYYDVASYREADKKLFKVYISNDWRIPPYPESGVYIAILDKHWINYYTKQPTLKIMYKAPQREYDYQERKNKISFDFTEQRWINLDEVSFTDIDFYIHSWENRQYYLGSVSLLRAVWKYKKEELELETQFAKMIQSSLKKHVELDDVLKTIKWWKLKNKWKRGVYIEKTDALAFRMIKQRVEKKFL
jgi:hypothetical protein